MRTLHRLAVCAALFAGIGNAAELDHREFDATLHAPFAAGNNGARTFTLDFSYPQAESAQDVSWRLELTGPGGQVVQRWQGVQRLPKQPVTVRWLGRKEGDSLPDGIYQVRMQAAAQDAGRRTSVSTANIDTAFARAGSALVEQSWDIAVGAQPALVLPAFRPLQRSRTATAAPAAASLPYTVYFGNLHSQTNHSDGGGALATCAGAQDPQSGEQGPAEAYAYAKGRGLDFLMASEHNHMFDGSDGTNTAADPLKARALYQSGLAAAARFNGANPNFLALYGMEWGVINNGGHLNIFNSPELLEWELNAKGQLIGDTLTPKNDYAALYTLMRQRGWIGQFNHPSASAQFLVNSVPLGYTADGDQAMALCEVLNTKAFSVNTTETETSRSSYEGACNKALEAGFHVAFSTDQDNHCANWGASYTNRTAVLIPNGTPLTQASFIDALRARRVYATMDKHSQLIFTANGHLMGERISNSGPLTLAANFSNSAGKTAASVAIVEGVPGRNGTVSVLAQAPTATVTPGIGEHFYYAKLTQNDGNVLWSAPVWVTQTQAGSSDTVKPSVAAGVAVSGGIITLSANASDDVGVTLVEFYIDGALKASGTAAPYSATIDSASLANGGHTLLARAYDAAGNAGESVPVAFSVNNAVSPGTRDLVQNGGFESGTASWSASAGVIGSGSTYPAHTGSWKAWLNGYGSTHTDWIDQSVTIPANAAAATLSFWLRVVSAETTTTGAFDTLKVQVRGSGGAVLKTLATYSNLNRSDSYAQKSFDLSAYKGQTVRIHFEGVEGVQAQTSFLIDDVALSVP